MVTLSPEIKYYDWGSYTALPELCQIEISPPRPVAELWYGAHPGGPAYCSDGVRLDQRIADDPLEELGSGVLAGYGSELPYLVKLLSADRALSLQAHPSRDQARLGFAEENAKNLPTTAPDRNYKDPNHKPEILIAVSEFSALAGFRPVSRTIELIDALNLPGLSFLRAILSSQPNGCGVRRAFAELIGLQERELRSLTAQVGASAARYLHHRGSDARWSPVASTAAELAQQHPGDAGVLGALMLNHVRLQPGQAVFLGPGQLHAYLSGTGVEVMASSDNVLRGGLTSKHVDANQLQRVLDFRPVEDPTVQAHTTAKCAPGETSYLTPFSDFKVSRIQLASNSESVVLPTDGPEILLCIAGSVIARSSTNTDLLHSGDAAWIPASTPRVTLETNEHCTLFRIRCELTKNVNPD